MFSSLSSLLDSFGIARHVRRRALSIFSRPPRWTRRREYAGAGLGVVSLSGIEPLEIKRFFAADIDLVGTVLTVAFDDAAADSVSLSINATGYVATGANTSSAIGLITELVVIDAGTKNTSSFTLLDASQTLSDGFLIDANVTTANLATDINASGGNVTVDSASVTLGGNVTSGGPQVYSGDVTLARNVTLTSTGGGSVFVPDYANASLAGSLALEGDAYGVTLSSDGGYAFVAAGSGGMQIIDVSNVAAATLVSSLGPSGQEETWGVTLSSNGRYAFIADGGYGLEIADVSNVAAPFTVSQLDLDYYNSTRSANAYSVTLSSDGRYAFVPNDASGLAIIDVSNVATPSLVSNISTGDAYDVALSPDGGYAFVADDRFGLQIFNVSNVASPSFVGNVAMPGDAVGVTLSANGQYAFVAAGFSGLQIVNVSNVASPSIVGNLDTTSFALKVTLSSDGRYAFVADGNSGLQIIDVSNVASPSLAGNFDTAGFARYVSLTSDGQYAFVADGGNGLQIVSLGSIETTAGTVSFGGTVNGGYSLTVNDGDGGTTAFAGEVGGTTALTSLTTDANGTVELAANVTTTGNQSFGDVVNLAAATVLTGASGSFAGGVDGNANDLTLDFTATTAIAGGFDDINNLTVTGDATLCGNITTTGEQDYQGDVELLCNTTLTSTGAGGWVSDYANPTLITNVSTTQSARNVVLSPDEQYAFVSASTAGLVIVDVSDPSNLTVVSTTNPGRVMQTSLSSDGQRAYLANIFPNSMPVLDVIDRSSPSTVGNVSFSGSLYPFATAVSPDDSLVYVGLSTGPAGVFSVIDASTGSEFASLNLTGSAEDIKLSADGRYAFVASGYAGLTVINLTGGTPTVESVTDTRNYALAVALTPDGAYAFTADKYYGVQVINLSNLASPFVVTDINTTGNAFGVTVSADGRYLFVADDYAGGLQILDIADPTAPVPVGSLDTPGDTSATALTADGRYAFVADGVAGGLLSVALGYELPGTSGISFRGTVDGGYSLTVNDGDNGTTTFSGVVGGTTALTALTTNANGTVELAANVTTTGNQSFGDVVNLAAATVLTGASGSFAGGVDGNGNDLTLNFSGLAEINEGFADINNLTVTGDATLCGNITTTGAQDYQADVELECNTTLTSGGTVFVPDYANASLAGTFDTSGFAYGVTLSSDGGYAFIADHTTGLLIIDVSDVANPSLVANFSTSGDARGVTLSSNGQYAFVANAWFGLQIIDVSNVASPSLAGNLDTSGYAYGVTLSSNGQYAFVADGLDGLAIIDVSNVASPSLVGSFQTDGRAYQVALSSDGGYAFVASGSMGLEIIDVSNVAAPGFAGRFNDAPGGDAYAVTLSSDGGYAFVAFGSGGLQIVDISNVAAPVGAGSFSTQDAEGVTLSSDGQYAFVTDSYYGLLIIDVSNVAAPVLAGSFDTDGNAVDVTLSSNGQYAFVADGDSGLQIVSLGSLEPIGAGSVSFGGTVNGGYSLTVNDGDNGTTTFSGVVGGTTALAALTTNANGTTFLGANVTVAGPITFGDDATLTGNVTVTSTGAAAYDYSNLSLVATAATDGSAYDVVLSADGSRAYVAISESGMSIFDVSNDANPVQLGSYQLVNNDGYARNVALSSNGQYVFLAVPGGTEHNLQIVDVSDPSNPTFVGGYNQSISSAVPNLYDVALSSDGRYAYLGYNTGDFPFQILDLSNLASPTLVGSYNGTIASPFGYAMDVDLSSDGRYAFVTSEGYGLQIIDVANAASPTYVGNLAQAGFLVLEDLALSPDEQFAYVAGGNYGLSVVDLSNLANPQITGQIDTSEYAIGVAVGLDPNYVFVADGYGYLLVMDVTDSANPVLLTNLALPGGFSQGIAVAPVGSPVYVANAGGGMAIVELATADSGGSVRFDGTVDGGYSLTVNDGANGTTTFAGTVGGTTALAALTTDANGTVELGGNVTTTGNQSYGDLVNLAAATVLTGASGSFAGGVDGNANDLTLDFTATTAIAGGFDDINNLTVTGNATLCGNITTTGAQDYQGDVELECNTTLTSGLQVFVPDYANAALAGNLDTSGRAIGVALSSGGQYAFVADYTSGLQIIDVSNVAGPVLVGSFATDYTAMAVTLSSDGRYAFVAADDSGLQIIDVSNVAAPVLAGSFETDDEAMAVTLSSDGRYAFVADYGNGLEIIDVSNVAAPVLAGILDIATYAYGVALSSDGGYAFVAEEDGLVIINVSNVANPTQVGSFETYGRGVTLSSDGLYAFIAQGSNGLAIIDISNVANPTEVGSLNTVGRAYQVTLSSDGGYAFVADGGNGLQIIDVSNVAAPVLVGSFDTDGAASGVTLSSDGRYAFVADGGSGLQIVSLGSVELIGPGNVTFGGTVNGGYTLTVNDGGNGTTTFTGMVGGEAPLTALTTDANGTAFLAANVTVAGPITFGDDVILTGDVTVTSAESTALDYSSLSLVATAAKADEASQPFAIALSADGSRAFVAEVFGGMGIYDVSDSAAPELLGVFQIESGAALGVALSADEQHAFLAVQTETGVQLLAVDVSDPAVPVFDGIFFQAGATEELLVDVELSPDGHYAYLVSTSPTPLLVVDVRDVANPTLAGSYNGTVEMPLGPSVAVELSADGRYAYIAALNSGGQIVDVANAASPTYVSGLTIDAEALDLALSPDDRYAYVAASNYGLGIFDVSNVASPEVVGLVELDGVTAGVTVARDPDYLFVADADGGLRVLDVADPFDAQVTSSLLLGGFPLRIAVSPEGSPIYVGNPVLGMQVVALGVQPGLVSFGGTVNGNHALTVNDGENGTTTFAGAVGGETPLTALTTDANGTVELGGNVTTTGNQSYGDTVQLLGDTTLLSGAGAIATAGVTDGGEGYGLTVGDANQTGGVVFGGNLSIATLTAAAGDFDVTLSGANNSLGTASFTNSGNLTLGASASSRTYAAGGLTAPGVATTFLAGNVVTDSAAITLNATSLTANAVLDSTNGGASSGATILLSNGTLLNGYRLETFGGQSDTEVTGDTVVSDGELIVESGSLNLGQPGQAGTLTATQDTLIQVANGSLNIFAGSTIAAGTSNLTMQLDSLNVEPGAGNITAGSITVTPATAGRNIFLGSANGSGLVVNQNAFDSFQTPVITIGGGGYNGTVDVGNLSVPQGRLDIIANGTGGSVLFQGDFVSTATDLPGGIAVYVQGSGATTTIDGDITSAGDVVIDDAVVVTDGSYTIDTSGTSANITITGGTDGIYGAAGQTNSLTFLAGTGTVTLGTLAGFGSNGGVFPLLENVTISAGQTVIGNTGQQISDTFAVLTGTLSLAGSFTAGTINVSSTAGTTLAADTVLDTAREGFSFAGTIDGAFNLSLDSSGESLLAAAVGGTTPLASLTLLPDSSTTIAGGGVTTTGDQTYEGAVNLAADTLLTATSGNVTFTGNSTFDGGRSLEIRSANTTGLFGSIGGTTPLASLTTDAAGTTSLGGDVTTSGDQSYGDDVTVDGFELEAALRSQNGSITFNGTLSESGLTSLDLEAFNGSILFSGLVSDIDRLTVAANATSAPAGVSNLGSLDVTSGRWTGSGTTGNLALESAATLVVPATGTTPITDYPQLIVTEGNVLDLGTAVLEFTVIGDWLAIGDIFTIIDNRSEATVTDIFAALPEGSPLIVGEATFVISYQGGDGNDVTLTCLSLSQNIIVSVENDILMLELPGGGTEVTDISTAFVSRSKRTGDLLQIYVTSNRGLELEGSPAGVLVDDVAQIVTVQLKEFPSFSGISMVGSAGLDRVTVGSRGVNLDAVKRNLANLSFSIDTGAGAGDAIRMVGSITAKGGGGVTLESAGTGEDNGIFLTGTVRTPLGLQRYAGASTLVGDTRLNSGGDVTFDGTLDGAKTVTISSSGRIDFLGAVGTDTPLAGVSLFRAHPTRAFEAPTAVGIWGDFVLDGSAPGAASVGLLVQKNIHDIVFQNYGDDELTRSISNFRDAGIKFLGGSRSTSIRGLTLDSNRIGISLQNGLYTDTVFQDNLITGSLGSGISLVNARNALVGGSGPNEGNLIIGGLSSGIYGTGTLTGTRVEGNTITANVGSGVSLVKARGAWIGGRTAGTGNLITSNLRYGLEATGDSSGSAVQGNAFESNSLGDLMTAKAKRLLVVPPVPS